ncbi:MAG: hypothetical protein KJ070_10805 [Verrucomicrobia bacterium]|nr:hypothetical protein [Verrucomicrobiota bacterium]
MNAENIVKLIEEMVDLKVQQFRADATAHLKSNPDIARLLAEKKETDQRRLDHIRTELVRLLNG